MVWFCFVLCWGVRCVCEGGEGCLPSADGSLKRPEFRGQWQAWIVKRRHTCLLYVPTLILASTSGKLGLSSADIPAYCMYRLLSWPVQPRTFLHEEPQCGVMPVRICAPDAINGPDSVSSGLSSAETEQQYLQLKCHAGCPCLQMNTALTRQDKIELARQLDAERALGADLRRAPALLTVPVCATVQAPA